MSAKIGCNRRKLPSWQRRHETVLHWLLENPWATQKQCADILDYSPSRISRIINAPEFQRRHRALREIETLVVMRQLARLGD